MKFFKCIIVFLLFTTCITYSQPWINKPFKTKSAKKITFYEIQKAFNNYWKNKKIQKGKGYKQFKRWEEFIEPRIFADGEFPNSILWNEVLAKPKISTSTITLNWRFVGPLTTTTIINTNFTGGAGRLNCIAFHPSDSNTIYVGAPSGGLWKTTDNGNTWNTTTDQLDAIGISDIVIDYTIDTLLFLATGDGDAGDTYGIGIIKSENGGKTWKTTSVSDIVSNENYFRRLIMHPTNPQIMIAASSKGIYRTSDRWINNIKIIDGHFKDLEFNPSNPNIVYAASYDPSGGAKFYKSTNNGLSFAVSMSGFTTNNQVNRIEIAVTDAEPNTIFALCSSSEDDGFYAIFKSINSGALWQPVYEFSTENLNLLGWEKNGEDMGGQGFYDLTLAISPTNSNEIYIGGVNVWKSENGGQSWKITGYWIPYDTIAYIHADHHFLRFSPHNNNELFSANDGGIYKTNNKGKDWIDISSDLQILQIYKLGIAQNDTNLIIAGNQDNGTVLFDTNSWYEVLNGDGMECYIDDNNNDIIYGSQYYGLLMKSYNRGKNFTNIMPNINLTGAWITPFLSHPKIPAILFSGYSKLYKSNSAGEIWTEIANLNLMSGEKLRNIAVAENNDNYIYISTRNKIWKTINGGTNWIEITSGLPNLSITGIAIAENNPNELWVSFSGYSTFEKIYHSSNAGTTWENYSFNLPNLPVNCIVYIKRTNNGLCIGTDAGVYYTDRSLSGWINYGNGLPNVIVNDIAVNYKENKIYAGTYGRGVWQSDLYIDNEAFYIDFFADNTNICFDDSVEFDCFFSQNPDSLLWNFGDGAEPSSSTLKDPQKVNYAFTGQKSVMLTAFKNGYSFVVNKNNYISVDNHISFSLAPNTVHKCLDDTIVLYATNNYDYTWSPSTDLSSSTGNIVKATPKFSTVYTVTGKSGSCTLEQQLSVILISNDSICNALEIHLGSNGPFSNACASVEENEPVPEAGTGPNSCNSQDGWCADANQLDNSVWFKFKAPENGIISVESSGFDNQMALYDADTCIDIITENYTLLAANDDFSGHIDYSSVIDSVTGLEPGKYYWLQIDGTYGQCGTFTLKLNNYILSDLNEKNQTLLKDYFILYPNPNKGILYIDYKLNSLSPFIINIYKINGEIIYSDLIKPISDKAVISLNTDYFNPGLYIIEFKSDIVNEKFKIFISE